MKIALLTPTFSKFSGIDRVVELQARGLSKKHEVTIFAFSSDLKPPKGVKLKILGMPKNLFLQRIYRLFFFADFIKINKTAKLLKGYDLAISHIYPMNLIAIKAKKYRVKYRFHNHGVATPRLFSKRAERLSLQLFNWLSNKSIKKADEVVSISKYLQRVLEKETSVISKVEPDKIDKKKYTPKVSGAKIRKKYNLGNKPVLLYAGRISPHKGVHLLLKAFNLVKKEIPEAVMIVVGKHTFPDYSKRLKKFAGKDVIFAGYVADEQLPQYYAACDVYTTATLWEGFNLTIAEANACGKKVVAFDVGPHKEVIKNGQLVRPGDVKAFAKAIVKLLP